MAVPHAIEDALIVWRELQIAVDDILFRNVCSWLLDDNQRLFLEDGIASEDVAIGESSEAFLWDVFEGEEVELITVLCTVLVQCISEKRCNLRPALCLLLESTDFGHAGRVVVGAARASSARRALAFAFLPAMLVRESGDAEQKLW